MTRLWAISPEPWFFGNPEQAPCPAETPRGYEMRSFWKCILQGHTAGWYIHFLIIEKVKTLTWSLICSSQESSPTDLINNHNWFLPNWWLCLTDGFTKTNTQAFLKILWVKYLKLSTLKVSKQSFYKVISTSHDNLKDSIRDRHSSNYWLDLIFKDKFTYQIHVWQVI